jgi:hypothetical protein
MGSSPQGEDNNGQREADAQADAIKERLLKDVESWSKDRSERSGRGDDSGVRSRASSASAPAARTRKSSVAAPAAKAGQPKKPFSMSYGGVTTTEYIRQNLVRRSRSTGSGKNR